MQNLLFSPYILISWEHFCQLFYFKMPTLVNSIQSDAPFPKYSTSIMIPLLASIFVKKFSRKFLHLRENFRIFAKISWKLNFRFGPNGNSILTSPHICLFYPPKMKCYGKKYHACRITIKFNGFFVFSWDFRENENFRETKFRVSRPIFAWFSHFRENWKMHFLFNPSFALHSFNIS
jgi:hypothetical protein